MNHIIITAFFAVASPLVASGQIPDYAPALSNSEVTSFAQDSHGYIWIGTAHGLNRYNGSTYALFMASGEPKGLSNDNILDICIDSEDNSLWIGTECGTCHYKDGKFTQFGDAVYNPASRILELGKKSIVVMGKSGFIKFSKDSFNIEKKYFSPGLSWIDKIILTSGNDLWYAYNSNDSTLLSVLDSELQLKHTEYLGKNLQIVSLCETKDGKVIAAAEKALFCFDAFTGKKAEIPKILSSLAHGELLRFVCPYKGEALLAGISGKGIFSCDLATGRTHREFASERLEGKNYICFVDKDCNIWLSDKRNGVRFCSDNSYCGHISPFRENENGTDIRSLNFDREGMLWAQTGEDLVCIEPESGRIVSRENIDGLSNSMIDSKGRMWTLSGKELANRYTITKGRLRKEKSFKIHDGMFSPSEDSEGNVWFALTRRLAVIDSEDNLSIADGPENTPFALLMSDPGSDRIFMFTVLGGLMEVLPDKSFRKIGSGLFHGVNYVMSSRDGTLWLGTYNDGLIHYDETSSNSNRIGKYDGIVEPNIKTILESRDGSIWFTTPTQIYKFEPQTRRITSLRDNLFGSGHYTLVSGAIGPDGKLYFGGSGGITVLDPKKSLPQHKDIPLLMEDISVNGRHVEGIPEEMELSHNQNTLSFRFAGLDFESGSRLSYSWKLDGYDKEWQTGDRDPRAVYSYIPPGRYVFRARVRRPDGIMSASEISLPVRIRPSLAASKAAKAAYSIFGIFLLSVAFWLTTRMKVQKERLLLAEKRDAMKQEQIDFVTNISHEFRTPLTMIYAPAKQLSAKSMDAESRRLADMILKSSERLRSLSSQVLGGGILHRSNEEVHAEEGDLSVMLRNVIENFQYPASEKNLTISTKNIPPSAICAYDEDKVATICSNLLSNAVKYTPDGGHISISLDFHESNALITVSDDGIGIPEEKRDRIFMRYDRLGAEKDNSGIEDSGIGLNYSRHLAFLLGGSLDYEPISPKGSAFTLSFPCALEQNASDSIAGKHETSSNSQAHSAKRGLILIVEDNRGVRELLRSLFSDEYNVSTTSDGAEAIDRLKISVPDAILSDVMMPNMDGYKLCSTIKESPDWCHIPVTLLTARSDAESNIEGLKRGADNYIPKPFDPSVLKETIASQIRNRRLVQQKVMNLTPSSMKDPEAIKEAHLDEREQVFLSKMHSCIESRLDDETLGVEELAEAMNMSYSSLYAKTKTLTGQTPIAFIKAFRMNTAMELLKTTDMPVSEVADRIGASSPSTFSRDFKKHFGISPSSVRKKSLCL